MLKGFLAILSVVVTIAPPVPSMHVIAPSSLCATRSGQPTSSSPAALSA
jgi:hypothetical protein